MQCLTRKACSTVQDATADATLPLSDVVWSRIATAVTAPVEGRPQGRAEWMDVKLEALLGKKGTGLGLDRLDVDLWGATDFSLRKGSCLLQA